MPWTVRLVEIIDGPDAVIGDRRSSDFGPRFGPVAIAGFRHEMWLTPDELVAMATTRSPYLVADEAGRRRLLDAVRGLLDTPELAGRDQLAMPHVTRVHRATVAT